jgi:Ca2+-binding EF-hand superfamily protein
VRQLPKVNDNKILYVQFLDLITSVGNRNHNPFKSLIHKLDFFLDSNKLSIEQLLTKMDQSQTVSLETFAKFLKDKVEKHKDYENILSYVKMMDIDKDGRICKDDLQTCLCNIDSQQFYKNGGQNLKHT